ncbi:response regulator [Verrucomicrobiota bacterium]
MSINILIIDDEADPRDWIRRILEGHEDMNVVGEAAAGEEGIKKAEELKPDVVVLDVDLPDEMTGIKVCERLMQKYPDLKIIGISGHFEKFYTEEMIDAGALGFVHKMAVTELAQAIRTVAEGKQFLCEMTVRSMTGIERLRSKHPNVLSRRKHQLLELIASNTPKKKIARLMGCSIDTVYTYRERLMRDARAGKDSELISWARKKGLLS